MGRELAGQRKYEPQRTKSRPLGSSFLFILLSSFPTTSSYHPWSMSLSLSISGSTSFSRRLPPVACAVDSNATAQRDERKKTRMADNVFAVVVDVVVVVVKFMVDTQIL